MPKGDGIRHGKCGQLVMLRQMAHDESLDRLVEMCSHNDAAYSYAYALLWRVEIHHQLGQFDLAPLMLDRIDPESPDEVIDLIRQLCMDKQMAPWRFKWSSGWPRTLVC